MANRIYGCDDCLAVCPWNKFASATSELKLAARGDLQHPPLALFLAMDDAAFRAFFTGSPVKRIGRDRFTRNCLIAAGNSNDPALLPLAERLIHDPDPVVRATAVWAVSRLTDYFSETIVASMAAETDETVLSEWRQARDRQQERA
jgi:epoxyqueuosine reductase